MTVETCVIHATASQGTVLGRASTYGAVIRILSEPFAALVEIELTLDDADLWVGFARSMFDDLTHTSQLFLVSKLVELIDRQRDFLRAAEAELESRSW
jgi:hypothetical protein